MSRFWRNRLPAMLLAMVMVLGMIPAAMAADCGHNNWGGWQKLDDTQHQRKCLTSDCAGTQTGSHNWGTAYATDGTSHWKKCADCGAETARAAHSYSGTMKTDASYHWDQCTVCGYKDNLGGHVDLNKDAKCDTCGYSMSGLYVTVTFKNGSSTYKTQTNVVKGTAPSDPGTPSYPGTGSYAFVGWVTSDPGSSAAYTGQTYYTSSQVASRTVSAATTYYAIYKTPTAQSITYTVAAGEKKAVDAEDFNGAYQEGKNSTSSIRWVEFIAPKAYTSLGGKLYYNYGASGEKALDRADLNGNSFYYSDSGFGDLDLNKLTFVADADADEGSVTITFVAYRGATSYVEGNLTLKIGQDSAETTIVYEVDTDDTVDLEKTDFNKVFQKKYPSYSVRWVEFSSDNTLSSDTGTLYSSYGSSDRKAFSRSSVDDYTFYYSDSSYGDYALNDLTFVSGSTKCAVTLKFRAYYSSSRYVDGTVEIRVGGSSGTKGDITYKLNPGESLSFNRKDFNHFFQSKANSTSTIKYVTFSTADTLSTSAGTVYYDYDGSGEMSFTKSTIDDYKFYYSSEDDGDLALADLSFAVPRNAGDRTVELAFTAYYSATRKASGTLVIQIGKGASDKADIQYEGAPEKKTAFDPEDFNAFFRETYKNYNIKYVTFKNPENLNAYNGELYVDYGRTSQTKISESALKKAYFYYDADDIPEDEANCYLLEDLSFVGDKYFDTKVTMDFLAYSSSSRQVNGTLAIVPEGTGGTTTGTTACDVLYQTTTGSNVQLKANDFARFLRSKYPSSTLQYVKLLGVPNAGGLYYNYYSASKYGTAARLQLTAANCTGQAFYVSPGTTAQYALSELTYVPSGTNYCAAIPFIAYGTGGTSATGVVTVSVTNSTVPEVYGVITKGTSVAFPAPSIAAAVSKGIGTFSGIQLLSLPASTKGTVYVGTGTTRKADIGTVYGYSSGTWTISQLRFVPAANFTGNVEIPYAVCDSTGKALGVGKFCLGVVNTQKKFSDVTASTWCYKYVAELSDAKVIDGYTDGTFKPDSKISYGAALKLIMLAAGYPEQKPTDSNPFSGYLAKARADGIITRSNVNLGAPITRLQVAQLAAGAMKLDTSKVSSVKPFTDTDNASVQALNEAGIVEGYFSNGTSTYKPGNTLTRGQVSAIVWRMQNYRK